MFSGQIHSRQPDGRRHLGGRRGWERCGFAAHLRDYPEHGAAAVPDAHLSHPLLSLAGARWTGRTGRDGTGGPRKTTVHRRVYCILWMHPSSLHRSGDSPSI
jgi:hypothetical protein